MWLFAVFVLVPIIEIALFIQIGGAIGLLSTLTIVVLTALAGTLLVRWQGLATLQDIQSRLAEGGSPVNSVLHGVLILAAGLLLLTPGFFTDAVGFLLLTPPVRQGVIAWAAQRIQVNGMPLNTGQEEPPRADVVDAEFDMVDPDDVQTQARPGSSGWTKGPEI